MKKLVLFAAVLVAVSFASCGGNKQEAPAEEVADTVAVEEIAPAVDSLNCACGDSACVCGDSLQCDSAACCQK
jgi:hypothetical protein